MVPEVSQRDDNLLSRIQGILAKYLPLTPGSSQRNACDTDNPSAKPLLNLIQRYRISGITTKLFETALFD